jgi:dTDP-4-dehydrorhamnose 3,5-epimerase-like enzyme
MIKKNGYVNREIDAQNYDILNIAPRVMHGLLNEQKKLDSLIYKSIQAYQEAT